MFPDVQGVLPQVSGRMSAMRCVKRFVLVHTAVASCTEVLLVHGYPQTGVHEC